jgi:site-specific DNA recombinase
MSTQPSALAPGARVLIRRIGTDVRIVASTMAKAEQQQRANIVDLRLEREVAQRTLADMGTKLHKMPTDGAVDAKERISQTERRTKELSLELAGLQRQSVEEGDLRTTLSQFEPVWESLNSREQIRIIGALIEGIAYNGETNKLSMSFRSEGIRRMCRGTVKDGGTES